MVIGTYTQILIKIRPECVFFIENVIQKLIRH